MAQQEMTTSNTGQRAAAARRLLRAGAVVAALSLLGGAFVAVRAAYARPAAGAQANFTTAGVKEGETEAGDLVADAVRAAAGADIAFVPAAAFRPGASVPRPATGEQAAGLMEPASDVVVVLSLQGKQIADALERAVSFAPQPSSGFLQVSGLKFTFDPGKPGGRRIQSVSVNGAPLDAVKVYKVATTRPLANGQQGYFQIWNKENITGDTGKTLAAALSDLARQRGGTLSASAEGRITQAGG